MAVAQSGPVSRFAALAAPLMHPMQNNVTMQAVIDFRIESICGRLCEIIVYAFPRPHQPPPKPLP